MRQYLINIAQRCDPDFVIGGNVRPYLLRWWLIPRNPVFNVYLHCFLRSDDDRALHDHPWLFNCSILLKGKYLEHTPSGTFMRRSGGWKFRWGPAAHRIELAGEPCWTVFITGPRVREWGFHCPQGWIHWKRFTAPGDKGAVGKGCDA
jgi:hypothetical protein